VAYPGFPSNCYSDPSYKELFPNLNDLTLRNVVQTETGWIVEAEGASSACCPSCGVASHSRHSRYWRRLRDLPVQGISVTINLQLGGWRCRSSDCVRQIFTERVAVALIAMWRSVSELFGVTAPSGRTTRKGERPFARSERCAVRRVSV
jgi:transposase